MLPQNYGRYQTTIRKGNLNGTILDSIAQAQQAIENYEKQSRELERTQNQLQFLITLGTVIGVVGGTYITYKFIKDLNKKKK